MARKTKTATSDSPTQAPPEATNGETTAVLEPPKARGGKPRPEPKPRPGPKPRPEKPKKAAKAEKAKKVEPTAMVLPEPAVKKVRVGRLKLDAGTQLRTGIKDARVAELREVTDRGAVLDPIRVWETPVGLIPSDGFHRIQLAIEDGLPTISALVYEGSLRDAIRDACSANAIGPMPRDLQTKRNAVKTLLDDPDWSGHTIGWLADVAMVSKALVMDMYQEHHERLAAAAAKRGEKYEWPKELKDRTGTMRAAPTPRPEKAAAAAATVEDDVDPLADDDDVDPLSDDDDDVDPLSDDDDAAPARKPKAVDPAVHDEQSDKEWINSLHRQGEQPLVLLLPEAKREAYLKDALSYRMVVEHPHVIQARRTALEIAKPAVGDNGIVANGIRAMFGMPHARDWKLCQACQGSGLHKQGGPCQSEGCFGNGYKKF